MTTLREAAQQALEALKGYRRELGDQQPCDAEQALEAALAELVQEPDSPERRCGGPGCDMRCCQPVQEPQGCAHCNHPLYAAVKCRVCGRVTEPTPPQRKPLSEDEKRALADKFLSCQPESYEVSGVFDLISAVERAHGIKE